MKSGRRSPSFSKAMCVRSIAREIVPGQHARWDDSWKIAWWIWTNNECIFSGAAQAVGYNSMYKCIYIKYYLETSIFLCTFVSKTMFLAPQKTWLTSTTTFNGESPWGKSNESGLKALHLSRHDCGKTKAEKPSPPRRWEDWRVSWKHTKWNNNR